MGKSLTDGTHYLPPQYYAVTREEMPALYDMVDRIAKSCGIASPVITMADHAGMANAFVIQSAQSAELNQSLLVVGTCFLDLADDDGIEGILAHECAHIKEQHPVQKLRYLYTVPTYINQYYGLLPWLLIGGLLSYSASIVGTIIAGVGFVSYLGKSFVLNWLKQKQTSQSVSIESEADERAVQAYAPAQEKLPHGLGILKEREDREDARIKEGFNALGIFVKEDEQLSAHVSSALLNFVNVMENNAQAFSAQIMATYPPMSERIAKLTAHPKKPLA